MRWKYAVVVLLGLWSSVNEAQWETPGRWNTWDPEYDEQRKPWKELQAQLPPQPEERNLREFKPSAATNNRFFIDTQSIVIGEDGVVRYTVVIRTASASNVLFEGMRCATNQVRLYAIGRSDGWTRAANSQWQSISRSLDRNRHHIELQVNYFCPAGVIVANAREAKDALYQGMHPRAINNSLP